MRSRLGEGGEVAFGQGFGAALAAGVEREVLFAEGGADAQAERFFEKADDGFRGFFAADAPFVLDEADGFREGGAVVFLDFQQRLEQAQAFLIAGVVGVEGAGEVEGAAEAGFPCFLIGAGGVVRGG